MSRPKFKLIPVTGSEKISGEKTTYRAALVSPGEISLSQLAYSISDKASQTPADVISTAYALANEIINWVGQGYRVNMGPMGSLVQKVRLKRKISDPKDVKNSDVMFDGIDYRLEHAIHRNFTFLEYEHSRKTEHLVAFTPEQRRLNILEWLKEHSSLSMRSIRLWNHVSVPVAQADLDSLIAEGLLRKTRFSGYSIYALADKK